MKRSLILTWLLVVLCTAKAPECCHCYYSQAEPYVPTMEKVTKLHFFLHDTVSGKNPSTVMVARPNITTALNNTPAPFGSMFATDDPLTIDPDPESEVTGNARGLRVSAGQDVLSLMVYMDFGFVQGEFNGSSIVMFSRNPITLREHEVAVVRGRGKFKMAKGFALLKTYTANFTTGDAIVECNVTVIHY